MRRRVVGENQDVLAFLVLKIIVDTFFFHQPRNEVEIRLAVLNAIVTRSETAVKAKLEILKPEVRENLLDDIGSFLVLKDPAIGRTRQEPQPRYHLGAIGSQAAALRALRKSADETVPVALGAVRIENTQGDVLSDDIVEVDRIALRQQIEVEMEELRDRFDAVEAPQQQCVLAEGSRDCDATIDLRVSHL